MYEAYGADTLRLYLMATGPLDASRPWETRDVVGMYRFLQRLWRNVVDEETGEVVVADDAPADDETRRLLHRTIDGVRTRDRGPALQHRDRQADRAQQPPDEARAARPREVAEALVLMLAPFAPHIAEELWRRLGHDGDDHVRAVPGRRPGAARRRDDRVPGAGQRQGARPRHGRRRRRRRRRSRPPRSPTPRSSRPSAARPRRRSSSCPAGWSTSSSEHPRFRCTRDAERPEGVQEPSDRTRD